MAGCLSNSSSISRRRDEMIKARLCGPICILPPFRLLFLLVCVAACVGSAASPAQPSIGVGCFVMHLGTGLHGLGLGYGGPTVYEVVLGAVMTHFVL